MARSCLTGADEVVKKAFDDVGAAKVERVKLVAARRQLLLAIEGAAMVVVYPGMGVCIECWRMDGRWPIKDVTCYCLE